MLFSRKSKKVGRDTVPQELMASFQEPVPNELMTSLQLLFDSNDGAVPQVERIALVAGTKLKAIESAMTVARTGMGRKRRPDVSPDLCRRIHATLETLEATTKELKKRSLAALDEHKAIGRELKKYNRGYDVKMGHFRNLQQRTMMVASDFTAVLEKNLKNKELFESVREPLARIGYPLW